jgi:hypothetical protein
MRRQIYVCRVHVRTAYETNTDSVHLHLGIGQMGLSMYPIIMGNEKPLSLLARLKEEGRIPSLSFGYQAGAPYRESDSISLTS